MEGSIQMHRSSLSKKLREVNHCGSAIPRNTFKPTLKPALLSWLAGASGLRVSGAKKFLHTGPTSVS